jgi:hypothetical protein
MAEESPQSYETHVRRLPLPYLLVGGALGLHVALATAQLAAQPTLRSAWQLLVALALGGLAWIVRTNSLRVQDRVIRLEERLRLQRLLPAELQPRIEELSLGQLVALRFASDEELPALVQAVLDEGLRDRDAIKRRVRRWRPDHLRV